MSLLIPYLSRPSRPIFRATATAAATWPCGRLLMTVKASCPAGMTVPDTTTANGRLAFGIFAAFAEFERELIAERTTAGLAAARARGRMAGQITMRKVDGW
jgi:hypothetical protein